MAEKVSENDPRLVLLSAQEDFARHACQVVGESRRDVFVLSSRLDPGVFDTREFHQALIDFARGGRQASVRILVKDARPMVEQGHSILRLARRLSSKLEIRLLQAEPRNKDAAWLMGDRQHLLWQHDDGVYQGFVHYQARVQCQDLAEEFQLLWDRHSVLDPVLRSFRL